ncbi:hypothetical protein CLF_101684, partial [Clonorchis sinensis]
FREGIGNRFCRDRAWASRKPPGVFDYNISLNFKNTFLELRVGGFSKGYKTTAGAGFHVADQAAACMHCNFDTSSETGYIILHLNRKRGSRIPSNRLDKMCPFVCRPVFRTLTDGSPLVISFGDQLSHILNVFHAKRSKTAVFQSDLQQLRQLLALLPLYVVVAHWISDLADTDEGKQRLIGASTIPLSGLILTGSDASHAETKELSGSFPITNLLSQDVGEIQLRVSLTHIDTEANYQTHNVAKLCSNHQTLQRSNPVEKLTNSGQKNKGITDAEKSTAIRTNGCDTVSHKRAETESRRQAKRLMDAFSAVEFMEEGLEVANIQPSPIEFCKASCAMDDRFSNALRDLSGLCQKLAESIETHYFTCYVRSEWYCYLRRIYEFYALHSLDRTPICVTLFVQTAHNSSPEIYLDNEKTEAFCARNEGLNISPSSADDRLPVLCALLSELKILKSKTNANKYRLGEIQHTSSNVSSRIVTGNAAQNGEPKIGIKSLLAAPNSVTRRSRIFQLALPRKVTPAPGQTVPKNSCVKLYDDMPPQIKVERLNMFYEQYILRLLHNMSATDTSETGQSRRNTAKHVDNSGHTLDYSGEERRTPNVHSTLSQDPGSSVSRAAGRFDSSAGLSKTDVNDVRLINGSGKREPRNTTETPASGSLSSDTQDGDFAAYYPIHSTRSPQVTMTKKTCRPQTTVASIDGKLERQDVSQTRSSLTSPTFGSNSDVVKSQSSQSEIRKHRSKTSDKADMHSSPNKSPCENSTGTQESYSEDYEDSDGDQTTAALSFTSDPLKPLKPVLTNSDFDAADSALLTVSPLPENLQFTSKTIDGKSTDPSVTSFTPQNTGTELRKFSKGNDAGMRPVPLARKTVERNERPNGTVSDFDGWQQTGMNDELDDFDIERIRSRGSKDYLIYDIRFKDFFPVFIGSVVLVVPKKDDEQNHWHNRRLINLRKIFTHVCLLYALCLVIPRQTNHHVKDIMGSEVVTHDFLENGRCKPDLLLPANSHTLQSQPNGIRVWKKLWVDRVVRLMVELFGTLIDVSTVSDGRGVTVWNEKKQKYGAVQPNGIRVWKKLWVDRVVRLMVELFGTLIDVSTVSDGRGVTVWNEKKQKYGADQTRSKLSEKSPTCFVTLVGSMRISVKKSSNCRFITAIASHLLSSGSLKSLTGSLRVRISPEIHKKCTDDDSQQE